MTLCKVQTCLEVSVYLEVRRVQKVRFAQPREKHISHEMPDVMLSLKLELYAVVFLHHKEQAHLSPCGFHEQTTD